MKTNSSTVSRNRNTSDNHPPLARDAQGNLLLVPDGTAAWCFKRETGGRPKMVVGSDRQPARFPLDTTPDDVEEVLGAGTYRVYAVTELGEVIDYVTTIVIGADDAAEGSGPFAFPTSSPLVGGGGRGTSSDLRYALETIREMSRYQADAMKAVAVAQADWVKGLATAKALPRNAPWIPAPAPLPQNADAGDEDDEDNDEESTPAPAWMQAVGAFAPLITNVTDKIVARFAPAPTARNAASPSPRNPMVHLAQITARLTPFERKFLNVTLCREDAELLTETLSGMRVGEAVRWLKEQIAEVYAERDAKRAAASTSADRTAEHESSEPEPAPTSARAAPADFMAHVMAVSNLLTAEERATVLWLLPRYPADRIESLEAQLLVMPVEGAAAWLRENLPRLRAEVGS